MLTNSQEINPRRVLQKERENYTGYIYTIALEDIEFPDKISLIRQTQYM